MPLFQSDGLSRGFSLRLSCRLQAHDHMIRSQPPPKLFQRFWRQFVSKILEYKTFQRFWRKLVSKILEEKSFKDFEGNQFQRFWRKIVSKILEENCFKDFGGNLFQRFWRKIVSKILEEICFKDFGGNQFQRFWRKFVSKILNENCFKEFGGKFFKDFGGLIFILFFFVDKSPNLSKIVSVLLSASVKRFFVFRMQDFCKSQFYPTKTTVTLFSSKQSAKMQLV